MRSLELHGDEYYLGPNMFRGYGCDPQVIQSNEFPDWLNGWGCGLVQIYYWLKHFGNNLHTFESIRSLVAMNGGDPKIGTSPEAMQKTFTKLGLRAGIGYADSAESLASLLPTEMIGNLGIVTDTWRQGAFFGSPDPDVGDGHYVSIVATEKGIDGRPQFLCVDSDLGYDGGYKGKVFDSWGPMVLTASGYDRTRCDFKPWPGYPDNVSYISDVTLKVGCFVYVTTEQIYEQNLDHFASLQL